MRIAVVLPAPFGPSTPRISPGRAAKVRFSSATSEPKRFATPSLSTDRLMLPA